MAKKTQVQKFRETARKLGSDQSADNFDATLKGMAKRKPQTKPAAKNKREQ